MGVKNFFPHPNELLIWAYPENLVKIGLLVEAVDCKPSAYLLIPINVNKAHWVLFLEYSLFRFLQYYKITI